MRGNVHWAVWASSSRRFGLFLPSDVRPTSREESRLIADHLLQAAVSPPDQRFWAFFARQIQSAEALVYRLTTMQELFWI